MLHCKRESLDRSVPQDMLNLLTIWFRQDVVPEVHKVLLKGDTSISSVQLDCWLGVVPQLIARMHHRDTICREALHNLLMDLAKKHPQVFPAFCCPDAVDIEAVSGYLKGLFRSF